MLSSSCNATQGVGIPDVLKNKRFTADYGDCQVKAQASVSPICTPAGIRHIMKVKIDFDSDNITATFDNPTSEDNVFLPIVRSFSNFGDIINSKKSPSLLTSTENVSVDSFLITSKRENNIFTYRMAFDLTFYYKKIPFKEKLNWVFEYDLSAGGKNAIRIELGRKTTTQTLPDIILFDQYPKDTEILNIDGFDGSGFYNVSVSSI